MSILTQFETFAINTETTQSTEGGCYRRRRRRYSGCYSYSNYSCYNYNNCGTTTEEPKEVTPEPTPTPTPLPPVSEAPSSDPIGCLNPEDCATEVV